jgi:hypothetical protein
MDRYLRLGLRFGVILLVAAGLGGCGGGGNTPPVTTTSSSSSEEPFPTPTTEDTSPTTQAPTPTNGTPIVALPRLPIGGASAPDANDPARQCVGVSWIGADPQTALPPGYAAEITGALFSARGYQVIRAGCGSDSPNCVGYVMRPEKQQCDLAVRTLSTAQPGAGATVSLKGIVYCPQSVGRDRCAQFAEAMSKAPQLSIELIEPVSPETGTGSATDTSTSSGG